MNTYKNTKKQGDAGLGDAIAFFTKLGWVVAIPLTDSQPYDLIVHNEDEADGLQRVQVKSSVYKRYENGGYSVNLNIKGGNKSRQNIKWFNPDEYDLLYVETPESRYVVPTDDIHCVGTLTLGKAYSQYMFPKVTGVSPA